jgi:hypothetical protein
VATDQYSRNPWMPVLWVLSALMIAGGTWGLWQAAVLAGTQDPAADVWSSVLPVVLGAVAPWLVGVGLATLSGVVLLHAARWHRS